VYHLAFAFGLFPFALFDSPTGPFSQPLRKDRMFR
jgi:hypothetical protein